ncbi:ThiF family adenylyltransferase [Hydrocarboniclastica marina]|uniref:ThiF family adenylyltransferase n=1 Tax=Hydrocarboniclastica marina TaxID=2259620 RepID=A0A4P7XGJ8_9ALTE|nr:ThiF family adenylyltransferase [Hydrocarboniclastica marina]QCF26128.1 ThiF family adenylyltransferase [Hydrocarboniclastica marina]
MSASNYNLPYKLALSEAHHAQLREHLFPGDGLEAAAIILCAQSATHRYVVNRILPVDHASCRVRSPDHISWPGTAIEAAIDLAEANNLSIVLIHSHPGGMLGFSAIDDDSDHEVMPALFEASELPSILHGSAIMTPNGAICARLYDRQLASTSFSAVHCAGDELLTWEASGQGGVMQRPMAFSAQMASDLKHLTACVVGVSGTGSIVVEQLARLGIGRLILIDFDEIEFKNLNRIVNATLEDARNGTAKVARFASAVRLYRDDIEVLPLKASIASREAIELAGLADVLFCCVDSYEGRQLCDRIAAAFLQPLFDVAVTIPTRQTNDGVAIGDVCGRVDYVKPGGSTLADRGVYTPETLRREYLRQAAPDEVTEQVAEGYIEGIADEAPSVISLNMRAASDCVMEFIARAYPFRQEPNQRRARTVFSLAAGEEELISETDFNRVPNPHLARGLIEPLLGMPRFSPSKVKA